MVELKRISIGSAAKVGAIVYALFFVVFGLLYVGFFGIFFSAMSNSLSRSSAYGGNFGSVGIAGLCIGIIGIVVAFIFGGIGGAIMAIAYNLTAGWVGGLEIQLNRIQAAPAQPAPLPSYPGTPGTPNP